MQSIRRLYHKKLNKKSFFREIAAIKLIFKSSSKVHISNQNNNHSWQFYLYPFFHCIIYYFFGKIIKHNTCYLTLYVPSSRPEQRNVHSISCVKWHSKQSGDGNIDILELKWLLKPFTLSKKIVFSIKKVKTTIWWIIKVGILFKLCYPHSPSPDVGRHKYNLA